MNLSERGSLAIMADNRAGVFLSVHSSRLLAVSETVASFHWPGEIARGKTGIKQEPILELFARIVFTIFHKTFHTTSTTNQHFKYKTLLCQRNLNN